MKLIPDVTSFVERNAQRNADPKYSMHSLELVITVILFTLLGRFIDAKADTLPLFTIVFGVLGAVGSFLSAYYRYMQTSKELDKGKVWATKADRVSAPVVEEEKSVLIVPPGYGQDD